MEENEIRFDLAALENNKPLLNFCSWILRYKMVLENEDTRYLVLASFISADTLVDVQSCRNSIATMNFIMDNMNYLDLNEELKNEVVEYLNKGLKIAKRDLKNFEKENQSENVEKKTKKSKK